MEIALNAFALKEKWESRLHFHELWGSHCEFIEFLKEAGISDDIINAARKQYEDGYAN